MSGMGEISAVAITSYVLAADQISQRLLAIHRRTNRFYRRIAIETNAIDK